MTLEHALCLPLKIRMFNTKDLKGGNGVGYHLLLITFYHNIRKFDDIYLHFLNISNRLFKPHFASICFIQHNLESFHRVVARFKHTGMTFVIIQYLLVTTHSSNRRRRSSAWRPLRADVLLLSKCDREQCYN